MGEAHTLSFDGLLCVLGWNGSEKSHSTHLDDCEFQEIVTDTVFHCLEVTIKCDAGAAPVRVRVDNCVNRSQNEPQK
jgi:hypothetical protein